MTLSFPLVRGRCESFNRLPMPTSQVPRNEQGKQCRSIGLSLSRVTSDTLPSGATSRRRSPSVIIVVVDRGSRSCCCSTPATNLGRLESCRSGTPSGRLNSRWTLSRRLLETLRSSTPSGRLSSRWTLSRRALETLRSGTPSWLLSRRALRS